MNLIAELKKNKVNPQIDLSEIAKIKSLITDNYYLDFLVTTNGGSLFQNSLQFYGVLPINIEIEINYNTHLFKKYYSELIDVLLVIGEDVFGNQFCFLRGGQIGFVNIETGELINSFPDFKSLVNEIEADPNYYSGSTIAQNLKNERSLGIKQFERIVPVKPFIIGGTYDADNLKLIDKEKLFDYSSYIAKQVKDLPEGTIISLKII